MSHIVRFCNYIEISASSLFGNKFSYFHKVPIFILLGNRILDSFLVNNILASKSGSIYEKKKPKKTLGINLLKTLILSQVVRFFFLYWIMICSF